MGNPTIRLFIRRELRAVTVGLATAIGFGAGMPAALAAGPTGGAVTSGAGSISHPSSSTTLIEQLSNQLTLTWKSFNVGASDTVQFSQPSASSVAINEILDANPSQIFGKINANGRIVLLNPNGILFGRSAELNVGSLIASSLEMTGFDPTTGHFSFRALNGAPGAIINDGTISAAHGGSVALLGGTVLNRGLVVADYGTVAMAAGKVATLDFYGGGLLRLQVSGDLSKNPTGASAAVQNAGRIEANGGQVLLTARATQAVFASAVNNSGIVRASHIDRIGGTIVLSGPDGAVSNSGTLDASGSGPSSTGGTVEVLGKTVSLNGHSVVDANGNAAGGTVYVGGGAHGANPGLQDSAATYVGAGTSINANALTSGNGGNVTVWSNGSTEFLGHIAARGDGQGNGGAAEVSGLQTLQFQGAVDLRAPAGRVGTLLLDPATISIVHGASGSGSASVVTDGTLSSELSTAQVSLTTSSGDLTISNVDGTVAIQPATQISSALLLNSAANITWNSSWSYDNNGALVLSAPHGAISASASGEVLTLGGSPALVMQAQSGIGSLAVPIETAGLSSLAASDSSSTSGIYLADSGTGDTVTVTSLTPPGGTAVAGITTTGSDVSLSNSGGAIALQNQVATQGGAVSLTSSGAISESGSAGEVNTTGTLTTSSSGGTVLGGTNAVGGLSATNSTSGNISLVNSGALSVSGINQSGGGSVALDNTGAITVTGTVAAGNGPVNLTSSGSIGESGGTISTTGTLTTSSSGGTVLGGANAVGGFNATNSTSGDISLLNSGALTVSGVNQSGGGSVSVRNAGGTTVSGPITVSAGALSLSDSSGALALGSSSISATGATLQGVGVTQSTGGVVNAGGGDVLVNGGGGAINMAGALKTSSNGATAALIRNATTVALPAISTGASGTTTIGAGDISAAVTQSGSTTISTGTLIGSTTGSVDLGNANSIGSLGSFSSTALTVNDTQPLTLTAALATGSGPVSLTSSGSISESGGQIGTTGTLTTVSTGGTLLGGNNSIGAFNASNSGSGALNLTDGVPLTVTGIQQSGGGSVSIANSGGITVSGPIDAGNGSVSLTDSSGLLVLGGSGLNGNGVVLQGVGVTQSGASVVNAGSGDVSVSGGSGAVNLAGTVQTRSNSATAVVVQSSNAVTLPGITTGSSGTTTINSGGVVTQSGSTTISTGTLAASTTSGSVDLGNANSIAALGTVTSSALSVNDSAAMNIGGLLNIGAGGIKLTTSGALAEVGNGSITTSGTTALAANNGGDVNLGGANTFGGAVSFTGHNVTLNANTGSLSSSGSASGSLEETAAGGISQSGLLNVGGPVTLNALSGSDIALGNYGNTFGGPVNFSGNNVIIESGGGLSGAGTAAGNLTLGTKGPAADLTIGKITAGGDVLLIAGDNIFGTGAGATVNANNVEVRYGIENPKGQLSSTDAAQQFGLASTSGTSVAVTVWSPAGPARPTQHVMAPTGSVLNVTDHAFVPGNTSLESALYNDPFGTSVSQIALGSLGSITSENFSQLNQGEANAGSESISGSEHIHLVYIDWASYNPNVTLFGTLNPAVCLPADQRIAGTGASSACKAPTSVAFRVLLPRSLLATTQSASRSAPAWSGLWAK